MFFYYFPLNENVGVFPEISSVRHGLLIGEVGG